MGRVLPILFNTDMVRAILDGRKTVTRRVVKKKDVDGVLSSPARKENPDIPDKNFIKLLINAPYRKGNILYVRETWGVMSAKRYDASVNIAFKAGGENKTIYFPNGGTDSINRNEYDEFIRKWDKFSTLSWHPSIHMPKEVARIWLKVKDVKVQRINDMTLNDFLNEGVIIRPEAFNDPDNAYLQAKDEFCKIWESTLKKADKEVYAWAANPWTWVIEFERCEKPEEL